MPPTHVRLNKYAVSSPADTSPLQALELQGIEASKIVAIVGKSEGNGCTNDFSRTLSALVWEAAIPQTAVAVFSGGTEGVLCPHVTILSEEENTGLITSVGKTRHLSPVEIGGPNQSRAVALTVKRLMDESSLSPADVHLVLVKCPLLTSTKMEKIRAVGLTPCTNDSYESMGKSRYASAVGIPAALDEIPHDAIDSAVRQENLWTAKASCSFMKDSIDAEAICKLLDVIKSKSGRVLQVFVKAEASPNGQVRGNRHTMLTDSDLHSTRHARAAVGGLVAGLTGDTQIYVSGGAEGQGPPGGGSLCMVYEV
ncbi:hypothetical protein P7C70_g5553, partial [Phenoliferia sp. Uapishka_3]